MTPERSEAHPVEGTWLVIRAVHAGEETPELVTEHMQLELARGKYRVSFSGKVMDRGAIELLGTPEHPQMLLKGQDGPNRGRTIPAIYQHRHDRLRICYGLDGQLPADFTSVAGSSRYVVFYRRKPVA